MPDPLLDNGNFKVVTDGLKDLKKEISDTRNLMIKTDNLVMGLSAELKTIQKKQEQYERKYIFNSVVAYIIFVVLIGTLTFLGFEQKVTHLQKEKGEVEKKLKENREELETLTGKIEKKNRVEREALEIYKALESGKREEALRGLSRLSMDELSVLEQKTLKDKIAGLKTELAQYAIEKATELLKKDNARAALGELERGKEFADKPEIANLMVILMAQAHQRLSKPDKAVEVLEDLVAKQQKGPRVDQALWNLAVLYEASREMTKAREIYASLIENHRESQYAKMAYRRLRQLEREAAVKRNNSR
jgi:tetratricopeptide (TPR) repeat protein